MRQQQTTGRRKEKMKFEDYQKLRDQVINKIENEPEYINYLIEDLKELLEGGE